MLFLHLKNITPQQVLTAEEAGIGMYSGYLGQRIEFVLI